VKACIFQINAFNNYQSAAADS